VLPADGSTVSRRTALLVTAAAAAVVLVMSTRGGDRRPVDPEKRVPRHRGRSILLAAGREWRRKRDRPQPALRGCPKLARGTRSWRHLDVPDLHRVRRRPDQLPRPSHDYGGGRPVGGTPGVAHVSTTEKRARPLAGYPPHAADSTYFETSTLRPIYAAQRGVKFRLVRRFTGDTVREALDMGGAHPRSWRSSAAIPGDRDAPLVLRWARSI